MYPLLLQGFCSHPPLHAADQVWSKPDHECGRSSKLSERKKKKKEIIIIIIYYWYFIQKQIVAHRPNYMLIYNFKTYKYK